MTEPPSQSTVHKVCTPGTVSGDVCIILQARVCVYVRYLWLNTSCLSHIKIKLYDNNLPSLKRSVNFYFHFHFVTNYSLVLYWAPQTHYLLSATNSIPCPEKILTCLHLSGRLLIWTHPFPVLSVDSNLNYHTMPMKQLSSSIKPRN